VADRYLLSLVSFDSDDLYITFSTGAPSPIPFSPVALPWHRHLNLQTGLAAAVKKTRKEVV